MTSRTQPSRTNENRRQNYIVLWADANINASNTDTKNTQAQLEKAVGDVQLITEPETCIRILQEFNGTRSFVIVSGTFGQTLVPKIHTIPNLESIFIYCGNKSFHEEWSKPWKKVLQVETKIGPICQTLARLVNEVKNDEIAMSFIQTDGHELTTELKQLEPSFMYTSLLKETLLAMEFTSEHIKKMIISFNERYQDDPNELRILEEFGKNYKPDKAIWWYTRECFLYSNVNRALRDLDGDIISDMGFFIKDLHKQIEKLHQEQLPSFGNHKFIVYRGQGLSTEAFEKTKKSIGGLIGFNCFLTTHLNMSISADFAAHGSQRSGCIGVIFVITIDPSVQMVPFAEIHEISYFPQEKEILFSMHTVFKIRDVKPLPNKPNIFQLSIEATNEDDPRLQELKNYMAAQYGVNGEERLARILLDMGQHEKSEEIYLKLLGKTRNGRSKGLYNHQLGSVKNKQGRYQEAIQYYENSLEVFKKSLPENHPDIATSYNSIGQVYSSMSEYSKALIYYEKSLEIRKKTLPNDHPDIATSYNNIGQVYSSMGEYSKALTYHEKSLEIRNKTLPSSHPDIGASYLNIGTTFYFQKQYSKALEYLEKAHRLFQLSLPKMHSDIKDVNDWLLKVKNAM